MAVGNFGWLLIVAAIGGIVVALQAQFIGLMDQHLGTLESVFITYVGGGLLILFVMLVSGGGNLLDWRSVPWYALSAGATGLVIIGALSYTVPRLGLVPAFTIFVASQFMTGAVLDHFRARQCFPLRQDFRALSLQNFSNVLFNHFIQAVGRERL